MYQNLLCVVFLGLVISPLALAAEEKERVSLPAAHFSGDTTVESALQQRRSVRDFRSTGITLDDAAQLLWAAQGITGRHGLRTAPSAGALYPLELYLVAGQVDGLAPGIYRYRPKRHELLGIGTGDRRKRLAEAALGQRWIRDAPAVLVITGVFHRTTGKYGQRGRQYVHMEVGHAAQNVYLQAAALDLGTVMVGAFSDDNVAKALALPPDHEPLALMPIGRER